jgi:hypothetical protein
LCGVPELSGVSPYAVVHPFGERGGAGWARLAGGDRVAAWPGAPGAGLLGSAWMPACGERSDPRSQRPRRRRERDPRAG